MMARWPRRAALLPGDGTEGLDASILVPALVTLGASCRMLPHPGLNLRWGQGGGGGVGGSPWDSLWLAPI